MGGWHGRFRPRIFVVLLSALIALFASQTAYSEHADRQRPPPSIPGGAPVPNKPELGSIGERLNGNTIAIISGNVNATYLTIAYDLSAVLDNGDEFRVLPVIGKGGGQNIKDVRYLKGIDLGITQSNLLNAARRSGEMGNIDDKIVYIAKLFNEEMHLVVRADSGITSIDQLAGKVVNFSDIGSGTQLSSRDIFQRLGIKVQEVNLGQADAVEQLKSGQIAATVLIAGKPAASMAKLKASEGFRALTVPFRKELQADYLPATLTAADYPSLVGNDAPVDTIACGAVLIAYNWPKGSDRYRRIQAFVDNFFPKLAEFQKPPRHPKWKETNLAAVLPGWNRFDGADEWIRQQPQAQRDQFDRFVAAKRPGASPEEREQLFNDFVQWRNAQGSGASSNTKGSN
jgi:TRAP transporter TAXI family solute receptor